jgi:hypothetical protein
MQINYCVCVSEQFHCICSFMIYNNIIEELITVSHVYIRYCWSIYFFNLKSCEIVSKNGEAVNFFSYYTLLLSKPSALYILNI